MVPSYWFPTFAAMLSSAFVLSASVLLASDPVMAAERAGIEIRPSVTDRGHQRSSAEPPTEAPVDAPADPGALRHRRPR